MSAPIALGLVIALCFALAPPVEGAIVMDGPVTPELRPIQAEQHRLAEVTFTAQRDHADPFNTILLDVLVTDPDGVVRRVPAFWAGGNVWRVRYSSGLIGTHAFRTECSDETDAGLHRIEGTFEVEGYAGDNPLYRHGPIRVDEDHRHFMYEDGTPFFWLGDTWWMGLCKRLEWPGDFEQLAADRVAKGFSVIQIVAGLYPDMPAFDERGANEAGFPWEEGYRAIRPEYFDAADRRLQYLADSGLVPCIVGAWGYFLPWMGEERLEQHWRYLIARYGALPVVWCIAGEANLPYYLAPGFPYDDREQVMGWTRVARAVRELDPFRRPISIHPTGLGRLSARGAVDDEALIDFDMLQTGHGGREVLAPSIDTLRWSYDQDPTMPVLNSEVSYEALLDRIPAEAQRLVFWASMLSGAAGQTYGANGIWQVNREGQPHGASPHGGNYGVTPWNEAMRLPGSTQLSLAKRLLDEYPWHRFEPHPEWASYVDSGLLSLDGCSWIWYPEGDPRRDAPVEARFFRRTFDLPAGVEVVGARVRFSADDACTVTINGQRVGEQADWRTGAQHDGLEDLLRPEGNVVAIEARNGPAPVVENPAGLICRLEVALSDGTTVTLSTDESWLASKEGPEGWQPQAFDDSAWMPAMVLATHGDRPWGALAGVPPYEVPYAAGMADDVRFVYVPRRLPVVVHDLAPERRYSAMVFDPVSGERTRLGALVADDAGELSIQPPRCREEDWVLVLEAADGELGGNLPPLPLGEGWGEGGPSEARCGMPPHPTLSPAGGGGEGAIVRTSAPRWPRADATEALRRR